MKKCLFFVITLVFVTTGAIIWLLIKFDRSKFEDANSLVKSRITGGVEAFYSRHHRFPSEEENIGILIEQGFLDPTITKDGWGNLIKYSHKDKCIVFYTAGPDMIESTEDDWIVYRDCR
jgi:hypothetical protein